MNDSMNNNQSSTNNHGEAKSMDSEQEDSHQSAPKRRNYGGTHRRPVGRLHRSPSDDQPGWYRAVQSGMSQDGFLILVNNASGSVSDRRAIDDQLARIALIQAQITANTTNSTREPRVVQDVVGFPPFTFSTVGEVSRGGLINLTNGWINDGMPTLLPFLSIRPPDGVENERRTAVLYAVGPADSVASLDLAFMNIFQPSYYTQSFGPETPDGSVYFVVQVEIFPEEVAAALGISPESHELDRILDRLEEQGSGGPRRPKQAQGATSLPLTNTGAPSRPPAASPQPGLGWLTRPTNGNSQ